LFLTCIIKEKVPTPVVKRFHLFQEKPEIKLLKDMPTGPLNRVADNSLAKELLGWEPQWDFVNGLHKTIDWYFTNKDKKEVEFKETHAPKRPKVLESDYYVATVKGVKFLGNG
jgi:dTDP-D-glucose 4,6-dehydratase